MANINGSGTAETLFDTAGDDTIVAFAGNDTIVVSLGGTDSVDGGADTDRLIIDARGTGGGINMAAPTAAIDGLSGSAAWTNAQVSFQHIENFTIVSSTGSFADNVTTGAGEDIFYHYGIDNTTYAADTIDLGAGTVDLLVADFSALTTHNVVGYLNFTPGHNLLTVNNNTKIDFTNVERLHLIGGALLDNVTGLAGDDILEGRGGNDILDGATGNDVLDGGTGDDTLTGGTGNDGFIIINGNDNAAGGADSDTLTINYGDATTALSTNGGPTANGGTGGFDGQYTIDASRRVAYSSIEQFNITTGSGNDAITTASGNDVVHAGSGDDLVNVGAGLDSADGGIGTDRISADMSATTGDVSWNLQANSYSGPAGTSFTNFEYFGTVRTGSGNDIIVTTDLQQDETIDVGGGNNNVTVRNGRDDVTAGSGTDTLVVDYANATTAISSLGAVPPAGPQPSANGFDGYFGDLTNRFVNYHGFNAFDVRTGSGNDILTMGIGAVVTNDIVSLGSGNDIAVLGRGVDVADGGIGTDGLEADLSQVATAISIDLNANTWSGPVGTSFTNFEYFTERDIGFATGTGNDNVVTRNADLDDSVRLGAGNDSVKVYDGTDFVVGFGLDTPAGQGGNDTLVVDYSAAIAAVSLTAALQTNSGEGYDSVLGDGGSRSVTFYGFDRFDITTGSGNDNLNFFGINTAASNFFRTGGGNDTINLTQSTGTNFIDGGTGNDTMTGGFGNDTYVVDSASDVVQDFFSGIDTIQTALASYSLAALPDIENLSGLGNVDQNLTGNGAANIIDGGLGADNMSGGMGNDRYVVDNMGDVVNELAGEGARDFVVAQASYTLQTNVFVEVLSAYNQAGTAALTLTGNSFGQEIYGNAGANILEGGIGFDVLVGLGGDDELRGGSGAANEMIGGAGNDTYVVSASGDSIVELAGGGTDTVQTGLSYYAMSGANVENLIGTSGLGQSLVGNAGDNRITGGAGNDELNGAGGNDTYVIGNAGDTIVELAGGGTDTIETSLSFYVMSESAIENLTFTGAGDFYGHGNAGDNVITGGAGNDLLDGGLGADTLIGNAGADLYLFDSALGGGNVDTISGFLSGSDRIVLDNSIFAAIAEGGLAPGAFVIGTQAGDADDRIIYEQATGNLFYDADGNGAGAAVQFATLDTHPVLTSSDFVVI